MIKQNDQLGKLIKPEDNGTKDAIHIAIYPVTAAEKLYPGQDVGFLDGKISTSGVLVGIVDPFLEGPVFPDQRCYIMLFPNTITGMRHEWEHPAFNAETTEESPEKATVHKIIDYTSKLQNPSQEESKEWLRAFAEVIDITEGQLLRAIEDWLHSKDTADSYGDYYCFSGVDTPSECFEYSEEMWKHASNLDQFDVPDHVLDDGIFTCSC